MVKIEEKELLNYAISQGIIDLSVVQQQIEMKKREEILSAHPYDIWQGSDGRWRTYVTDSSKKNGRRQIPKKEKRDLENVVIEEYLKNNPASTTIKALYEDWIEYALAVGDIEKNTADRYQNEYDRFIKGTDFECKDIRTLSSNEVIQYLKSVVNKFRISRKAFSNLKTVLSGIYSYAKSEREIDCISLSYTMKDLKISDKKFATKIIKDHEQVFNEEEALLIANYILENYQSTRELGVLFALLTGLRVGELVALKNGDQEKSALYIQRTEIKYKDENNKTVYDVREFPKTKESMAEIELTDSALDILRLIRKTNIQNGITSEYLFYEEAYGRLKSYFFDRTIRKICKRINIPVRSMHKLRKTYASYLLANGVEEKIAQAQLRHKDSATTHKYYEFSIRNRKHKQEVLNDVDLLKKCNQV